MTKLLMSKFTHRLFLIGFVLFFSSLALSEENRELSAPSVSLYLQQLSSMMVGRPIIEAEKKLIEEKKQNAIPPILEKWMTSEFFIHSLRSMVQSQFSVSGTADGIDFNLPANLVSYIAKNKLPYSSIITASYCVDAQGNKITCDTNAPFSAGILTTRAYMVSGKGRFNLRRARRMIQQLICKDYPLSSRLQPPIPKSDLLPMFQVNKQSDDKDQFGNGSACYACHSQFGAHAQLYVKFDTFGKYQPTATGEQDTSPGVAAGLSKNNLYTSHLSTNAKSLESSQILGKNVAHLGEAAQVISEHPLFLQCGVRNALQYYLRLLPSEASAINQDLLAVISNKILQANRQPTFQEMIQQALSHPLVIESVLKAGGSQ